MLGARHVAARARVHADALALLDEQRHLDDRAGLQRRRLRAAAGDRVPTHPRVGLADLQVDRARQLNVGGLLVDEQHIDLAARRASAQRLADAALGHGDLLVGLHVHEVRIAAVGVEELHLARLGAHRAELLPRSERAVDYVAVAGAPELGAHERPALAGLDVLELEHLEDRAVDLDVVAVAKLVGADRAHALSATAACGRGADPPAINATSLAAGGRGAARLPRATPPRPTRSRGRCRSPSSAGSER